MLGYCPTCRKSHAIVERFGATLGVSLAFAALGARARHPLVILLAALAGAAAGRALDHKLARECPECRTALQLVATLA